MQKRKPMSRVTRTKEEAKASYDKMSGWYDVLAGNSERKYKEAGLLELNVQNGEKVLEVGYGTGECLIELARSVGVSGKVDGIDLSERMYRVATAKIDKTGLAGKVELLCGDAARLPYAENSLDAIFSSFTLELFDTPEIPIVLQQCQRVLCPGGRLCLVAMVKREKSNPMMMLYEWAHRTFPQYADCRPIYAQEALHESGFEIVDVTETSMFGLPVDIILACASSTESEKPA